MASGTWSTGFWGQNQWNDLANPTFTLTGVSLSGVLGTTTEIDGDINTGWGRIEWGINAWGEFGTALPTGIGASFNLGTIATWLEFIFLDIKIPFLSTISLLANLNFEVITF